MNKIKWAKIILQVVLLILGGISETMAVSLVSAKFHVPVDEIRRHSGDKF